MYEVSPEEVSFPVEMRDMWTQRSDYDSRSVKIPRRKCVVRKDTDQVLQVVSDDYSIIKHQFVLSLFSNVKEIKRTSIVLSEDGGIMMAYYDLPQSLDIKANDTVDLKLRAFNSYNLSTTVGFEIIGKRLVCSNGLIMPSALSRIAIRHMNPKRIFNLSEQVQDTVKEAVNFSSIWQKWALREMDEASKAKIHKVYREIKLDEKEKQTLINRSLSSLTVWDAFNVLTKYTTHDIKVRGKNALASKRKREIDYANTFYKYFNVN